jgi:hypothetical protein
VASKILGLSGRLSSERDATLARWCTEHAHNAGGNLLAAASLVWCIIQMDNTGHQPPYKTAASILLTAFIVISQHGAQVDPPSCGGYFLHLPTFTDSLSTRGGA